MITVSEEHIIAIQLPAALIDVTRIPGPNGSRANESSQLNNDCSVTMSELLSFFPNC